MLRLGRLPPIDGASRVAVCVAAELPERFTHAGFATAMYTQGNRGGEPLGGNEQRRQRCAERIGLCAENGGFVPTRGRKAFAHRWVRQRRSITSGMVAPSARAEKLSAMRWRNTGCASAATSSIDGAKRPPSRARARAASMKA